MENLSLPCLWSKRCVKGNFKTFGNLVFDGDFCVQYIVRVPLFCECQTCKNKYSVMIISIGVKSPLAFLRLTFRKHMQQKPFTKQFLTMGQHKIYTATLHQLQGNTWHCHSCLHHTLGCNMNKFYCCTSTHKDDTAINGPRTTILEYYYELSSSNLSRDKT